MMSCPCGKRLPCLLDSRLNTAGEPDKFFFSLVIQLVPIVFVCFKEVVHDLFWIQNAFLFLESDFFVPEKRIKVRIFSGEVF